MKTEALKQQLNRAGNYIELIEKAERRIIDFKTRIDIEENKPRHEAYLMVTPDWLAAQLSEANALKKALEYRLKSVLINIAEYAEN